MGFLKAFFFLAAALVALIASLPMLALAAIDDWLNPSEKKAWEAENLSDFTASVLKNEAEVKASRPPVSAGRL